MNKRDTSIMNLLTIAEFCLWGVWVYALLHYWHWLDARRLAGIMIFALFMMLLAIIGARLELRDTLQIATLRKASRAHFLVLGRVLLLILIWMGGTWGLLRLITKLITGWLAQITFIVGFVGLTALVIYGLMWLSDRDWTLPE